MLKLTPLEFFSRGLPEAFLFVFAVYTFSKRNIDIKKGIISSILYALIIYMVRFLPIHYGVHTIINVFALIIITVNLNKIDLIPSIRSSIIVVILQFICEGINAVIIKYIFKADINYIFKDPVLKIIYGIPSIMIFACVVVIYYIKLLKRKELKNS